MRFFSPALSLLWSTWAFAGPCVSQTTGMQVAVDNTPIATILESSVNISGIVVNPDVDYITSAACWISAGPRCNIAVISEKYSHEVILGNDTISAYSSAMVAALRNFKIDSEEKNAMYNAVDSAWIIYPKGLNLQVGDSLYIKDYSAILHTATPCEGITALETAFCPVQISSAPSYSAPKSVAGSSCVVEVMLKIALYFAVGDTASQTMNELS